jgi:hypothetical protein
LKDNVTFAGIKINDKNFMERAEARRIEANRAEYERLQKDPNYIDVRFNEKTGGLLAVHREHSFDPTTGKFGIPRGDYERIASEVLYRYGKNIVLKSERLGKGIKAPEGLLDGKLFDIKGIEGTGEKNIHNDLKKTSKKKAEVIVFYYHDKSLFVKRRLIDGYSLYLRTSKSRRVSRVYYIVEGKLYSL